MEQFVSFINTHRLVKPKVTSRAVLSRIKAFEKYYKEKEKQDGNTRVRSSKRRSISRRRFRKRTNRTIRGGGPLGPTAFDNFFTSETLSRVTGAISHATESARSIAESHVNAASATGAPSLFRTALSTVQSVGSEAMSLGDKVLFPLYHLEQVPVVGALVVGAPLDLTTMLLNNIGIVMNFLGPILPVIAQLVAELGSAIPIPGVNTVFAAAGIGLTIGGEPIEFILTHLTQWILMFIYIARKQWNMAYMIALEALPVFGDVMDSLVLYLSLTNKYLEKASGGIQLAIENLELIQQVVGPIWRSPSMLLHPTELIDHAHSVLPNNDVISSINSFWSTYVKWLGIL
jgi:hypothetical protein